MRVPSLPLPSASLELSARSLHPHHMLFSMSIVNIRAALIDLSGTLHVEDHVIPGAIEAVKSLRNSGVQVRFATNTTKESRHVLWERLSKLGFDIQESEMFTSLTAARNVIASKNLKPFFMVDKAALSDFEGFLDIPIEEANAVVVGLAPDRFNYSTMNQAMNLILSGASLIAIHRARYFKKTDGLSLGPGPFVTALEYATGCTAHVVGKPEATFFKEAASHFSCDLPQVAMIGDDVRDDVLGAQAVGMTGILVKTGKYLAGDESKYDVRPISVCNSIVEAVELITKQAH